MTASRFEGITVRDISRSSGELLPGPIKDLYFESLELDYPSLTRGRISDIYDWMLSGRSLGQKQTRNNAKVFIAEQGNIPVASVAVTNVTSGKLGTFGSIERRIKAARGKTWRELGFVARSAAARELDPVDPTAPEIGITDALVYGAINGNEQKRLSLYPWRRKLVGEDNEGEKWVSVRAQNGWGLQSTGEDEIPLKVPSGAGEFMVYQSRMVSQAERFAPPGVDPLKGADVLHAIQNLKGAREVIRQFYTE